VQFRKKWLALTKDWVTLGFHMHSCIGKAILKAIKMTGNNKLLANHMIDRNYCWKFRQVKNQQKLNN